MMQEYLVPEEAAGTRIDKFLADACPDLSRSFLQKLLKESSVTADGKAVKSSFKVNGGETIAFEVPKPQEAAIEAENIPLDILYEDSDVILVNKPKGMVVHPAAGHYTGTLVNVPLQGSALRHQRSHAPWDRPSDRYEHDRRAGGVQE